MSAPADHAVDQVSHSTRASASTGLPSLGINGIWERDLGIAQKFLTSPTPRAALVLGKGFSAGIRTLSQAVIVYGLALLLGVKLNWSPLALLNVLIIVVLAATRFSTLSLIIACIVKTRERFMGVGQPVWLRRFARLH